MRVKPVSCSFGRSAMATVVLKCRCCIGPEDRDCFRASAITAHCSSHGRVSSRCRRSQLAAHSGTCLAPIHFCSLFTQCSHFTQCSAVSGALTTWTTASYLALQIALRNTHSSDSYFPARVWQTFQHTTYPRQPAMLAHACKSHPTMLAHACKPWCCHPTHRV